MNKWKQICFELPTGLLEQFANYIKIGSLNKKLPYRIWRELKQYFEGLEAEHKLLGVKTDTMNNIYFSEYTLSAASSPKKMDNIFGGDDSFGDMLSKFLQGDWEPWNETGPHYESFYGEALLASASIDNLAATACACGETLRNTTAAIQKAINTASIGLYTNHSNDPFVIDQNSKNNNAVFNEKGEIIITENKERESNNMKFNFDFGTCENDNVRVSPYGIAIKNATGTWVSYDAKTGNIIDVDIFNFNGGKYLFKMPVAIKDVKVGDIVIHNRIACFVKGITDGTVVVIDPYAGEEKSILFTKTPFGFDFVTKVVCLFDNLFSGASNDNPFGNMLPFFLMSNSDNKNSKDGIDPLMMAMLLSGGNCGGALQNPMMLALMCADQTNMHDVLPLMMLAGQNSALSTPAAN